MKTITIFFFLFLGFQFCRAQNKYFKKGMVFIENKDYQKAISCFDKSIKKEPELKKAYLERAKAKMNLKRKYPDYCEDFQEAFKNKVATKADLFFYSCGK